MHIVVVERHRNVEAKWAPILRQLPKGGCEVNEGLEETALREVAEETGLRCIALSRAGTARWAYQRDGRTWVETVTYFFLRPVGGRIDRHDKEFDVVRWLPIRDAERSLSYPEERQLLHTVLTGKLLPEEFWPPL